MGVVRFQGTYEFRERDCYSFLNDLPEHRKPPGYETLYGRWELKLDVKGELNFEVGDLKGDIPINFSEKFVSSQEKKSTMQKDAMRKFKSGGVEKMIREEIIKAIRRFKWDKESEIAEKEYKELMNGVKKYNVEFYIKPKDLDIK